MTQPKALGYAVSLEARGFVAEAAELRRLHEEIQALRQALAQPKQRGNCTCGMAEQARMEEREACLKKIAIELNKWKQGIVTQKMIQDRVQKEIDELRQALAQSEQVLTARVVVTGVDAVNMSQERVDETAKREHEPVAKIWLWRNFVNDKPEYWAFDNPYPINLDNDDPQTIGSPCGYALLKPSRDGSRGRKEDEVLREIKGALARQQTRSQSLAQPEQESVVGTKTWVEDGKVFTQNLYASDIYKTPPKREWVGLTDADKQEAFDETQEASGGFWEFADYLEAKLKEKNT